MGDSLSNAAHPVSDFQENDIRPDSLRDEGKSCDAIDCGRLLSKIRDFVEVPCPACLSPKAELSFKKNQLHYLKCRKCETVYVSPRPSEAVLDWFYHGSETYRYWNERIFPASEQKRREKIFIPRVDRTLEICERFKLETESLLELGCAYGTYCEEILKRERFQKVVGVEATPQLAERCRRKGIEIKEGLFETLTFGPHESFSVIASFEVIEHLFDPSAFLQKCFALLKPRGIAIVTCPNVKGFDFQVLGEKCSSFDHEHLNYFHPASLTLLMESLGFEVIEKSTPGRLDAELVRNKVLQGEFDLTGQPFLQEVLISRWHHCGSDFQNFISQAGLSSNMWIVAQKPA